MRHEKTTFCGIFPLQSRRFQKIMAMLCCHGSEIYLPLASVPVISATCMINDILNHIGESIMVHDVPGGHLKVARCFPEYE